MAQHDYDIANQAGAAFRSDINSVLDAIVSNNSGATEPATTFAFQWWADTTANQLKIRNAANDGWIILRELDGTLLVEDGAVATPGIAFADDVNTGIYSSAADTLNVSAGGVERAEFGTSAIVFNEDGAAMDFRVEGDTNANLLFVDGSADAIGVGTSAPGTLIEIEGSAPYVTIKNNTEEDTDGGRECKLIFEGEQSGGELSRLGEVEFNHDGTGDDEAANFVVRVNDGNDGTTPTSRFVIDSTGLISTTNYSLPLADGSADQAIVTNGSGVLSFADRSRFERSTAITVSGTSATFSSIPSWARKITFAFVGISLNSAAHYLIRIGDSGGMETTGYQSTSNFLTGGVTSSSISSSFGISLYSGAAHNSLSGQVVLSNYSGNAWAFTGLFDYSNTTGTTGMTAGYKGLTGTLDRLQLLADDGTSTFDSGTINILIEG